MLASFLLSFSCTPAGPPGVSLNSFLTQRPDLLSWVYVRPLAFGLSSNLSPHLALYRVRVPTFISLLHASFSHILSDAPLRFATLGDEYLRPIFHRLELRHARHTKTAQAVCPSRTACADNTCLYPFFFPQSPPRPVTLRSARNHEPQAAGFLPPDPKQNQHISVRPG